MMMKTTLLLTLIAALALTAFGQSTEPRLKVPTLSPQAEVSQQVALTEVKLSYARPSAKGRKVMGELVPYGEIWRTGANASSKFTFSQDVSIAGNKLKAGEYALYTIPGETEWTIIIHKNTTHRALTPGTYKQDEDAFRFKVKPEKTGSYIETFTIAFTDLKSDSVNVDLSWEYTNVKFRIDFDVDGEVDAQIAELAKAEGGMSPFNYFLAAEYYLNNGKDLEKAKSWIDSGLEKAPKNPRFGLLKAKILHQNGERSASLKAIEEANQWAKDAKNGNYISQTQLFWDSNK
jgi:hypothetical protein